MKWRFQFRGVAKNQQRLNQLITNIENRLAGKLIFDRPWDWSAWVEWDTNSTFGRTLHVRFETDVDALDVYNWCVANIATIRNQVQPGGVISLHYCSHDEQEVFDCRNDPRAQYQEIII